MMPLKILFVFLVASVCNYYSNKGSNYLVVSAYTPHSSKMVSSELNKKSTALQVLQVLNDSKKLASYVTTSKNAADGKSDDQGVAVVTGGNSGIGSVTVETLALTGMKIVLCCRNAKDGERVLDGLSTDWCRANVRVQSLDLSDLDSIESCVNEIIQKEGRIDLLLNNAGIMALPKRETTKQNFEQQLGVNHIGHFFLTRLLLPHMNDNGRVVSVASIAHSNGKLDLSNLNYDPDSSSKRRYSPWGAYGQSKLANVLFAKTLNEKLREETDGAADRGILSVSLHPGVISTGLWKHSISSWLKPILNAIVTDKTVEQGAATNVYTSLVDGSELDGGGGYFKDCANAKPSESGSNSKLGNQLWIETEKMIENAGYSLPKTLSKSEVCSEVME